MTIKKEKAVQDLDLVDEKIIFDPIDPRDRAVIDSIGLALVLTESDRSKGRSANALALSRVVRRGMKEQRAEVGESSAVIKRNLEDRVQISKNQKTSLVIFTGEAEDIAEAVELAGSIVDARSSDSKRYLNIPEGVFEPALLVLRADFEEFKEGVVVDLDQYRNLAGPKTQSVQSQTQNKLAA